MFNIIMGRLACKEISIGGYRGWRLKILEAFIIILTFTKLLYLFLIYAGVFSNWYGPGYRDTTHGVRTPATDLAPKPGIGVTETRV
ncbi:Membrane protein PM19L [Camellia lanceoleosa]|uniref:Membrane protein PM19L n=1 Tax=Camellia lanceoleosa TaxID=1840588 RepID=A0ACC0HBY3_9ERIC|nr:Membrane protein PM19L [Camellia lanceoleosa]